MLGWGVGFCSGGVPLYIAEIAPAKIRGRIIAIEQVVLCFGELLAFWLNYGFNYLAIDSWWRIPLAIQIVPAAVLGIGCWIWVPPSPRWLVAQDRLECAQEVLTRLHGSEAAEKEIQDIRREHRFEKVVAQATWAEMFKMPVLRVTLLGMGVQFFQQITGTNSILYYTASSLFWLNLSDLADMLVANAFCERGHIRSQDRESSNRRCGHCALRLRLDTGVLLRPPWTQDLATDRSGGHDVCHDRHHSIAVACRAQSDRPRQLRHRRIPISFLQYVSLCSKAFGKNTNVLTHQSSLTYPGEWVAGPTPSKYFLWP